MAARSYRLELQPNVRSGIQIRDQAALQPGYGVFEQQLALFEPGEAQMIRADIICKAEDGRIEITVLLTQLGASSGLCDSLSIESIERPLGMCAVYGTNNPSGPRFAALPQFG